MKGTFISRDHDFASRSNTTWLRMIFLGPILLFALVTIVYSLVYFEGRKPSGLIRTKWDAIQEGLSHMNDDSILIACLCSVIFIVSLVIFLKAYYRNRNIIIELHFNDSKKELSVKSKTVAGLENQKQARYQDITFQHNHLSDGMTPPMYDTLTLFERGEIIGHVYQNHFTWDITEYNEIKERVKNS